MSPVYHFPVSGGFPKRSLWPCQRADKFLRSLWDMVLSTANVAMDTEYLNRIILHDNSTLNIPDLAQQPHPDHRHPHTWPHALPLEGSGRSLGVRSSMIHAAAFLHSRPPNPITFQRLTSLPYCQSLTSNYPCFSPFSFFPRPQNGAILNAQTEIPGSFSNWRINATAAMGTAEKRIGEDIAINEIKIT